MRTAVERDLNPLDEPELTYDQEYDLLCEKSDDHYTYIIESDDYELEGFL